MPKNAVKRPPGPHPYNARSRHQDWFMDGRRMDVAVDGVHWWSLIMLEGYSRTILAGMIAPTEATWVALMVRYTACLPHGAPRPLVSDSGGASTSADVEAVCTRWQIQHETIVSTQGESSLNWMETHVHVQRRLYDDPCSWARTPAALDQCHQAFMQTDTTTAHQGLLQDRRMPPVPVEVLGAAKGRMSAPEDLAHHFSQAVFPRTTKRYGGVRLHRSHFSIEEGFPHTRVLLWVSAEPWRAVDETAVFAAYHCHDDWRDQHVTDSRDGMWYATRVASPQGALIPLTPQDARVVYHSPPGRRRRPHRSPPQPLALFEWEHTG